MPLDILLGGMVVMPRRHGGHAGVRKGGATGRRRRHCRGSHRPLARDRGGVRGALNSVRPRRDSCLIAGLFAPKTQRALASPEKRAKFRFAPLLVRKGVDVMTGAFVDL